MINRYGDFCFISDEDRRIQQEGTYLINRKILEKADVVEIIHRDPAHPLLTILAVSVSHRYIPQRPG
jgi:hypothetical protein